MASVNYNVNVIVKFSKKLLELFQILMIKSRTKAVVPTHFVNNIKPSLNNANSSYPLQIAP